MCKMAPSCRENIFLSTEINVDIFSPTLLAKLKYMYLFNVSLKWHFQSCIFPLQNALQNATLIMSLSDYSYQRSDVFCLYFQVFTKYDQVLVFFGDRKYIYFWYKLPRAPMKM